MSQLAHPNPPSSTAAISNNEDEFSQQLVADSPTVGRVIHVPLSPRNPKPPIPSPLSAKSWTVRSSPSPSPRTESYPLHSLSPRSLDPQYCDKDRPRPSEHTTFYSDSSREHSPEPSFPRPPSPTAPDDFRIVTDPLASRLAEDFPKAPKSVMSDPAGSAQEIQSSGLPRNSSIDSAISNLSTHKPTIQHGSQDSGYAASDVAGLVSKAGSPDALIQSLLKEKHAQSQQNSQLWRLVDKQRAMIMGLNKDLEKALKEKEKYRMKLREVMNNPAFSQAIAAHANTGEDGPSRLPNVPRIDVNQPPVSHSGLDSPSQLISPVNVPTSPYPVTPITPSSNASEHGASSISDAQTLPTETSRTLPKVRERAQERDHGDPEEKQDPSRKPRKEEYLQDVPVNISQPPTRALPPDPPKVPPPKPPTNLPPSAPTDTKARSDGSLSSFPAPPRKAPPAPLQLVSKRREPVQEEETESDLDEILEAAVPTDLDSRGRRRTRAEDDHDRESRVLVEAAARSASKKSKSSQPDSPPPEDPPPSPPITAGQRGRIGGTLSLAEVLQADEFSEPGSPPLMSPGLPASPRPGNMRPSIHSPPLSPRTAGGFPASALSPRPPRQAIPMPPNTPLATPAVVGGEDRTFKSSRGGYEAAAPSPGERTKIYRGLVTDEHPDLLLPPNALPSIVIHVASSRMKPSRASLISLTQLEEDPVFTLAVISRSDGGELWRLEKDSASLLKLDSRLKHCPAFLARTPDKSLFSGHAPAKVDARRAALEHYMDEVLNTLLDQATALELCKYLSTNTLPPNVDEMGSSAGGAREGSSHMIGPDGRPIRSGYLTKRGKNFGGWKSRFFLLDGPLLKYYETPGGAHLGTIKLQHAQIVKHSHSGDNHSPTRAAAGEESDNHYRHAFRILEPKRKDISSHVKHVLCAENDKERDLWVDALLQWTVDHDEEEHVLHQTKPHGHHSGAKTKKGSQGKSNHGPSDSDTLVAVRYDSTQVGETPISSGRAKPSGGSGDSYGHQHNNSDSMASKLISGPKDPQPIADLAAWGNRMGLTAPTPEEKKARKRSFFGFGSKTRSNSDGQDSIPSVGDLGSTAPAGGFHGSHQVFGSSLAEAVRYTPPVDVDVPLPSVVYRCIQFLEAKDAVLEEGIFRLSGSSLVIKSLRERFNNESDVNLVTDEQFYDIHAVASLLKLYLRELPSTILTRELHLEFLGTTEISSRLDKIAALNELVQRLPLANATLLKYLIAFLIKIINNSDMNKMPVRNVGIVFSPTLNIPAPVFAMFLQNYEPIFGIAPEEYELPSARMELEMNRQFESPVQFDPPPPRPSTSSGSASPHRQPRLDSMRNYHRTTPTPPLTTEGNPVRGSPTPPLVIRPIHDSPYAAAQSYTPRSLTAESGSGSPTVAEGLNTQSSLQSPTDDGGNSLTVQEPSSNSRRRESAMYMGNMMGLQPQGSKSRLREETRF